jgi:hypothetical protein
MVEGLELDVVAEYIEREAVCLPQEAEPGCNHFALRAILGVLPRH